ncbi:MAG TPA: sulfotransferase domain-containing protein [Rhizomicrobium sp.]|nr:sulfotransferase domain-containing protein [Rhizomicrobium sp.]
MAGDRKRFVGTFHKTGTVLLASVFRHLAHDLGLIFWQPRAVVWKTGRTAKPDFPWDICMDSQSRFLADAELFTGDLRCVISIRDPRDVVISSARYHMTAPEKWLHRPDAAFGGATYQQALNALATDHERYVFEMDHSSAQTIAGMLAVDRGDPRIHIVQLDRLIVDAEFEEYRRMFEFLGFEGEALSVCLHAAQNRSALHRSDRPAHFHHEAPELWKRDFTPALAEAFEARFPGAAQKLGYEPTLP